MMSNCLSRLQYTCICQWRELEFRPDWNEPDQVVILPLIAKLGMGVSWTSPFHSPHRLPEVCWWFGEDHVMVQLGES